MSLDLGLFLVLKLRLQLNKNIKQKVLFLLLQDQLICPQTEKIVVIYKREM